MHLLCKSERRLVDDGGFGVGHGEHHRDAAGERRRGARREVLLVRVAWLAQVHVYIDQTCVQKKITRIKTSQGLIDSKKYNSFWAAELQDTASGLTWQTDKSLGRDAVDTALHHGGVVQSAQRLKCNPVTFL